MLNLFITFTGNLRKSKEECYNAHTAAVGYSENKFGPGQKKKSKRHIDHNEKLDMFFDCLEQPIPNFIDLVKEIHCFLVVPPVAPAAPQHPPQLQQMASPPLPRKIASFK